MKLDSFRALLIKKAETPQIKRLIKCVREGVLMDAVYESLEKMATARHAGDTANSAVLRFGKEMSEHVEPHMIHDALSHHVSRYKSALDSGNQDLANQHAKASWSILNLGHRVKKHAEGKLQIDALDAKAWERNSKLNVNENTGKFKTDTKGWNYPGKDFSWLKDSPHGSHVNEVNAANALGAYPIERIKVNGKHIHLEDVPDQKGYEGHEFDHHPIMQHYKEPAKHRTEARDSAYVQEADKYKDSTHFKQWMDRHEAMHNANPTAYDNRGSTQSPAVHKEVAPLDVEKHKAVASNRGRASPSADKKPASNVDIQSELANSGVDVSLLPDELKAKWGIK